MPAPVENVRRLTACRVGRRPFALGRSMVWLIPVVMGAQALVYGGIVPSQVAGRFPIVRLATFNIRLEEPLIIGGVALWLLSLLPSLFATRPVFRLTPIFLLCVWAAMGLAQAAMHGMRSNNTDHLMEARALAVPLLYFVVARYWMSRVRLTFLARVVRAALLPAVVVLTLGILTPISGLLEAGLALVGGIYGGNATALEPIVVFILCLLWAQVGSRRRPSARAVALLLFVMAGMIVKLGKTNWVYVLEVPILFYAIYGRNRLGPRRGIARRRLLWISGLGIVLLVGGIGWLRTVHPGTLESFLMRSKDRITRPDADGDWSGGRFAMNREGLRKLQEEPITGIGLGVWYELYWHGVAIMKMPDHFAPLWFGIRGGLFTLLPIAILALWYLRQGYRACRRVVNRELQGFVTACYMYTVAMMAYSLYGVPQNLFEPMILFWMSVAVVLSSQYHFENNMGSQNVLSVEAVDREGRSRRFEDRRV